MKTLRLMFIGLAAFAAGISTAYARDSFSVGINVGIPGYYAAPPAAYYAPPVRYYVPPVVYAPPPVYYGRPAPAYYRSYGPRPGAIIQYRSGPRYYGYDHGHRGWR